MKTRPTFLSIIVASLLSVPSGAQVPQLDFETGIAGWRTVVDGVMGGRSTGHVSHVEGGVLRFAGDLSLENNGGFSQIRGDGLQGQFLGSEGLLVRVKGDGRTYQFDVRCSNARVPAGGYQREFVTVQGEWTTLKLYFKDFELKTFGRTVPNAPALDANLIESIGITLADYNPGAFQLDVDFVRAIGSATALINAPSDVHLALLRSAIERGVPLFNTGDVQGCAAVYQTVIEAMLVLSPESLTAGQREAMQSAMAASLRQAPAESAWTLRRAIDSVLAASDEDQAEKSSEASQNPRRDDR